MAQNRASARGRKNSLAFDPPTTAWIVVLGSFLVFCGMCIAGVLGTYWFLFDSTIPTTIRLTVSSGAVTVTRQDGTSYVVNDNAGDNTIPTSVILQTDNISQGYLTFADSGHVIADIFLLPNSSLTLNDSSRPRFDWSKGGYGVTVSEVTGHFSIDVPNHPNRASVVVFNSPLGTAHLTSGGQYMITALADSLSLYTEYGAGVIYNTPEQAVQIMPTKQGTLHRGQGQVDVQPYPYTMLNLADPGPLQSVLGDPTRPVEEALRIQSGSNSTSVPIVTAASTAQATDSAVSNAAGSQANQPLPLYLGCSNVTPDKASEPTGTWSLTALDEELALRLYRTGTGPDSKPLGHAETGCIFYFSQNSESMNLDNYSSLSVRAKMKIHFQNVPTCGVRGSECPVMLQLVYQDQQGNAQAWYQGFYAVRPPEDTSVLRCESCSQNHIQINSDAWFIYDSGDLLKQLPNSPASLNYIRVYSSGHLFDVAVSDLSVVGGQAITNSDSGGN
ncbi:MAG TPA: hypothetical protein VKQ72_15655 [Aggregatilineales bacterium]|nr:hypothetical protein [Aggregatilineales bacterium]